MSSKIDLHVHSTVSDGSMTPKEIVKYAKEKDLKAIAITDHDSIGGIDEAIKAGKQLGVEVIPGVEINCDYGFEVHILGLFIDYKLKVLHEKFLSSIEQRNDRNKKMVKKLNQLGIDITYQEVLDLVEGKIISRSHFAQVLVKKGYVKNIKEAFKKYLELNKPGYIKKEKTTTPKEAIELIKKAKGISILAHAGLFEKTEPETEDIIKEFIKYGLDGIEVYHSDHDKGMTEFLLGLAHKYNLAISGGSDFHGKLKDKIDLGTGVDNLHLEYEILENLKKYRIKTY